MISNKRRQDDQTGRAGGTKRQRAPTLQERVSAVRARYVAARRVERELRHKIMVLEKTLDECFSKVPEEFRQRPQMDAEEEPQKASDSAEIGGTLEDEDMADVQPAEPPTSGAETITTQGQDPITPTQGQDPITPTQGQDLITPSLADRTRLASSTTGPPAGAPTGPANPGLDVSCPEWWIQGQCPRIATNGICPMSHRWLSTGEFGIESLPAFKEADAQGRLPAHTLEKLALIEAALKKKKKKGRATGPVLSLQEGSGRSKGKERMDD